MRPPSIEVLHSPGCGSFATAADTARSVAAALAPGARVEVIDVVARPEHMDRFSGSPTVLVDGVDLEPWVRPRLGAG